MMGCCIVPVDVRACSSLSKWKPSPRPFSYFCTRADHWMHQHICRIGSTRHVASQRLWMRFKVILVPAIPVKVCALSSDAQVLRVARQQERLATLPPYTEACTVQRWGWRGRGQPEPSTPLQTVGRSRAVWPCCASTELQHVPPTFEASCCWSSGSQTPLLAARNSRSSHLTSNHTLVRADPGAPQLQLGRHQAAAA